MIGYCREIAWPQRRHRPRSSSQDTIGILSRQAIGCRQLGQVEGGWNNDRSFLRSEEHTSELQSPCNLVCRLLLEKKNIKKLHVSADDAGDVSEANVPRDRVFAGGQEGSARLLVLERRFSLDQFLGDLSLEHDPAH